jgi:hypothetical protein
LGQHGDFGHEALEPPGEAVFEQTASLLDPKNDITLSSLQRAAAMVGRRVSIELV